MPRNAGFNAGLAILRLVVGIVFMAHGWQKFFDVGIAGIAEGFAGRGIPLAGIVAPGVALLELAGGAALALGLLTRLVALLLAIDMVAAILIVHVAAGFFLPAGYEFTLTLFAACVALTLLGPGDWSVDHALRGHNA